MHKNTNKIMAKKSRELEKSLIAIAEGKKASSIFEDERLSAARRECLEFYKLYDLIEGTQHSEIFKQLYFGGAFSRKSRLAQSLKMNIDVKTLYHYRKLYLKMLLELYTRK